MILGRNIFIMGVGSTGRNGQIDRNDKATGLATRFISKLNIFSNEK
jgi:hypothetical protein